MNKNKLRRPRSKRYGKLRAVLYYTVMLVLVSVMLFSGYKLFMGFKTYSDEGKIKDEMLQYKPVIPSEYISETEDSDTENDISDTAVTEDQFAELQMINENICAWITIDGTNIDYPIVQHSDNEYYLTHNVKNQGADAGAIFLDFRCNNDFSSDLSIVYGHQMNNGSMFQDIRSYRDNIFCQNHSYGWLTAGNKAYRIDFLAYMTTDASSQIYSSVNMSNESDFKQIIDFIKQNAQWQQDIPVKYGDRLIVLSTCTYEYENARSVLVGKLTEIS